MFSYKENLDDKFDMKSYELDNDFSLYFDENEKEFNLSNQFEISTEDNENKIYKNKDKQIKNYTIPEPFKFHQIDNNNNINLTIQNEPLIFPEIDNSNESLTIPNEVIKTPEIDNNSNNNASLTIPNEVMKLPEIENNNKNLELPEESQFTKKKEKDPFLSKKTKKGDIGIFNPNNIIRKCKCFVFEIISAHINNKIKYFYNNNIGKGIFKKQLLSLNQHQKSDSNAKFNKELLNMSLKEIFSSDISGKYSNFDKDYNKKIVENLLNEKDIIIKDYFTNLFNLTFIQCIEHYIGEKTYNELKGMRLFEENINGDMDDEYSKTLEYYLKNFKNIINNKNSRKSKKKDKIKN